MNDRLARGIGLAGIAFAGLEVAGNLSIGAFPDADAPIAKLMPFYASHHVAIARGGLLLHWAALFLALFAVALWFRIRSAHPLLAGAALLGAAVAVADELAGAGVYSTLGFLGGKESVIAPAALQAVHVNGAGGGLTTGDGGLAILLLAVAVAGIRGRAFPRWLALFRSGSCSSRRSASSRRWCSSSGRSRPRSISPRVRLSAPARRFTRLRRRWVEASPRCPAVRCVRIHRTKGASWQRTAGQR